MNKWEILSQKKMIFMCLVGIHNDTNDRRNRIILLLDDYFGTCKQFIVWLKFPFHMSTSTISIQHHDPLSIGLLFVSCMWSLRVNEFLLLL